MSTPAEPQRRRCQECGTKLILHCLSVTCTWWFCGKCQIVTDPHTGRSFRREPKGTVP